MSPVTHRLDVEGSSFKLFGECSCRQWSTGPRRHRTSVEREWRDHVADAAWAEVEAEVDNWPWDDPCDWAAGEALTMEEVVACR